MRDGVYTVDNQSNPKELNPKQAFILKDVCLTEEEEGSVEGGEGVDV